MELAEETKEIGEVITFEPRGTSSARWDKCKPAVALETATANLTPTYFATFFSNFSISFPCVKFLNRICLAT